ncbi:ATP-binding cassette domain-containing protein [Spiroplasma culicicola]|uniref:ABC transporter domain-containing protein n=1 Tax=Spiroplasma culicicola AES-1 TaxID=1276246 RepID=W6A906_9MOLU|nr:ATP-binding cassette domain-containing protein [Spiroplasma culicicola]AHI53375.1 hypothetical protein SCULI_v1c10350 [Spiroplasma culicicola AES-1]
MKKILKLNYKRLLNRWYIIAPILLFTYFPLFADILTFSEEKFLSNITPIWSNIQLNVGNLLIILIMVIYLYNDYLNGLWTYTTSTNIKPRKIIFSYMLTGLIICFFNVFIQFFWKLFYYHNQIHDYGVILFMYDYLFDNIIFIIFILMFLFYKLPAKRDLSIIFICANIAFNYFQISLLISTMVDSYIVYLIVSFIPIINIYLLNSLNPHFWIVILLTLITICVFLFLFLYSKKQNNSIDEINIKLKVSSFFTLEVNHLKLNKNDVIGIVGENGSGKSTFMKCLYLYLDTKNISKPNEYKYDVLQQITNLGMLKNFDIADMLKNNAKSDIDLLKLFKDYKLHNYKNHCYSKMSPGQQQRFKFMLLEIFNNDILILDEPFNFLDNKWEKQIGEKIKEYKNKYRVIFIINHDLDMIKSYCNRIIEFEDGQIIKDQNL